MSPTPAWVKQLKPSGPQGHELLAAERANSNIPVEKVSELLFTKEVLEKNQRILDIIKSEKVFDKSQKNVVSRTELFRDALAKAKRLRMLQVEKGWSQDEYRTAMGFISEPLPYGLHDGMFVVTLKEQGTPEQHELFLKKAEDYKIIGCYAQTELGHGSNVRGLETTATWNSSDKTFTIHSPHLTASKWWIGSLGKTANHACVMAQLYIDGKSYGPHPFIVQIRDMKTHEPLENVHVGDIGPKFGYNSMDNGFLLFNKVKVPHNSMLARFSRVDPQTNKYVKPQHAQAAYGTMTWVRSTIVMQAGSTLARGVTIATRYCAIRRQFQDRDAPQSTGPETPVLDYTMVQVRILPLLAATFALHFTGKAMMNMYDENQKSKASGGSDMMADLHASSCGLKALSSTIAAEGLEVCRRACGGHGYSAFSGIGSWYATYLPTTTFEGDNYMLTQQVANYLLKSARSTYSGAKPTNDTTQILSTYLSSQKAKTTPNFSVLTSNADLVSAFAHRAASLTFAALKARDQDKKAWNDLLVDFYRLSKAHAQYMVVKNFYDSIERESAAGRLDSTTLPVMWSLYKLFALTTLETESGEFRATGAVSDQQLAQLTSSGAIMGLLKEIRPHAVRLVDSWAFDDYLLDSSLGRKDGHVYEDMFLRASEVNNPLNRVTIDPYPESSVLFKSEEADFKAKL